MFPNPFGTGTKGIDNLTADRHEVVEIGRTRLGPFEETFEVRERLNSHLVAAPAQRLGQTPGGGARAPVA